MSRWRTPVLAVGVYDALSARLAERAGFELLFVSGFGVAGAQLGEPDLGLLTQTEILDATRRIAAAVDVPVIADGDTGHGGPLNAQRLVRELVRAGAAGVLLEDQVWPKRCGHMDGKEVVAAEEHVQKIRAAIEARGEADFAVIGRTDAREPLGLDEAILRGRAYAAAGADVIFVEAPLTREELKRIAAEVPGPLMANMIEDGKTPLMGSDDLFEMGYHIVVYPLTGLLSASRALERAFAELRETGRVPTGVEQMTFSGFTANVGVQLRRAQADRFKSD